MQSSRILGIDAARGAAMLLVCLSHFLLAISYATAKAFNPGFMITITAVSSPAFVTISGITFGYLVTKARGNQARVRVRFIERALLLLVPVHLLLRSPHLIGSNVSADVFRVIEITDAIAVAMIVNVFLVKITGPGARLCISAAAFGVSWIVNLLWQPDAMALLAAKDLLVRAAWDEQSVLHGFAVLPWAAVHLAATTVGERLAVAERSGEPYRLVPQLAIVGGVAMLIAVLVKVGELWWRSTGGSSAAAPLAATVRLLSSPLGKYPPTPGYLAFCGGAALIVIAMVFLAVDRGWLQQALRRVAVVGRASLCVWIVQAWLYWGGVQNLPVPAIGVLPVYFALSLVVIGIAASVWDSNGWNRYLTLGFTRWLEPPRRARDASEPT